MDKKGVEQLIGKENGLTSKLDNLLLAEPDGVKAAVNNFLEKGLKLTESKLSALKFVLDSQKVEPYKYRRWLLGRLIGEEFATEESFREKHNIVEILSVLEDKRGDKYEELFWDKHPEASYEYNIIYGGKQFRHELDGYDKETAQALEIKSYHNNLSMAIQSGMLSAMTLLEDSDDIQSVRLVAFSVIESSIDFVIRRSEGSFVIEDILYGNYYEAWNQYSLQPPEEDLAKELEKELTYQLLHTPWVRDEGYRGQEESLRLAEIKWATNISKYVLTKEDKNGKMIYANTKEMAQTRLERATQQQKNISSSTKPKNNNKQL